MNALPCRAVLAASLLAAIAAAQTELAPAAKTGGPSTVIGPCPLGQTNLCIPLDNSFQVVVFDGPGGSGPANPADPCQRNDDDVTLAIPLQFTFDLYGQQFNSVFINNNGNISFGQSFSTFTSTGFPVNGFPMVAPFWADVDTRDPMTGGVVYFRSEANRFVVTWDHVGYFAAQTDKLNTFQVIISDGTDPLIGLGNNVCFCYDDMQWTTGSASGGVGGFGGTPATVGVNAGNGVDFFQIGRFDHAGADYDGPDGNADGVSFLDNSTFCFSVGNIQNQPPVFLNPPMQCVMGSVGVPIQLNLAAIGPEGNQTVTLSVNDGGLANFNCVLNPGNPATATCTFTPGPMQTGQFNITVTACDNFMPQRCTTIDVCFLVAECHLVLGGGFGDQKYDLFGHVFETDVQALRSSHPVTMDDIPDFPVPQQSAWGHGGLVRLPRPVYAQVVMYNPQLFPHNPDQHSQVLRVRFRPNGQIVTQALGTADGIQIGWQTYVDANGQTRLRFPFTIDGM